MNTSDWIALAAALAAFIGIIPQFAQLTRTKSRKIKSKDSAAVAPGSSLIEKSEVSDPVKLNQFGRALVLTAFGLCIGALELIFFSALAAIFEIDIDTQTLPANWLVAFYAIFIIPSICFLWAIVHPFDLWERP